jgi:hypothetical protein
MKKLIFLCACLLALLATPMVSYAADPVVLVVRVYDSGSRVHLVISGVNEKSETHEFDSGTNNKSLAAAGREYQKLLTRIYQDGYSLKSTFSTTVDAGNVTTLIFVKGE